MESEKRLIDANAVDYENIMCSLSQLHWLNAIIEAQPTVDAVEVVHGRWILGKVEPGYFTPGGNRPWICSECGEVMSYRLDKPRENYCPNCGAKMDGDWNG